MTTFSQLIDRVAKEVVRPDFDKLLPAYLNQTVRELFIKADTQTPVCFDEARVEAELTVDSVDAKTGAFVWAIPDPTKFQLMESVFYDSVRRYVYPGNPKTALMSTDMDVSQGRYYYRVGQNIVFSNPGKLTDTIRVSWFEYPRSLYYYKLPADRPVTYNEEDDLYVVKSGFDPDEAMAKSTNWLIRKHPEMLAEGMRAKFYKRIGDDVRMRTHYSQYESSRAGVQNTESVKMETLLAR